MVTWPFKCSHGERRVCAQAVQPGQASCRRWTSAPCLPQGVHPPWTRDAMAVHLCQDEGRNRQGNQLQGAAGGRKEMQCPCTYPCSGGSRADGEENLDHPNWAGASSPLVLPPSSSAPSSRAAGGGPPTPSPLQSSSSAVPRRGRDAHSLTPPQVCRMGICR